MLPASVRCCYCLQTCLLETRLETASYSCCTGKCDTCCPHSVLYYLVFLSWQLENLERLKVCFEDNDLSRCDVMLADITGSRRVDKGIHDAIDASSLDAPVSNASCVVHDN